MTYLAIAYRWGWTNAHHYFIYAGPDKAKARALAQAENNARGGKYGCAVIEFSTQAGGEQKQKIIAYYNSSWNEKALHHNHRIDMFNTLGHRFHEFAEGTVLLPENDKHLKGKNGKPMRALKPHQIKPPKWVVDENKRAEKLCEFMFTLGEKRLKK